MPHAARLESAAHLRAPDGVVGLVVGEAPLAGEGLSIGEERVAGRGELGVLADAVELGGAEGAAHEQHPVLPEDVLQLHLVAEDLGDGRPIARLAEEARIGDDAQLAVARHHAAVERDLLLGPFELVPDGGVVADLLHDRRRGEFALGMHRVAEAVGILEGAVDAHRRGVAEGRRVVALDALEVVAAGRERDASLGLELRLLGGDGHGPARFAAPEERRARTLEDLHLLHGRCIAQAAETPAAVESVDQIPRREVRVSDEAADREAVPEAAEHVLPRHARREVERIVELHGADLLQHFPGDHLDRLGEVLDRHVAAIVLALRGDLDLLHRAT